MKKILWAISIIPLIIGIFMWCGSVTETVYSTSEYWVAKDYNHVYEKYSGEIVDSISDNEKCYIKGDKIIVKEYNKNLNTWGKVITINFGIFVVSLIVYYIGESDWWNNFRERLGGN